VTTVLGRLDEHRTARDDSVGGSTYTIDIWDGHPLAEEVCGRTGSHARMANDLRTRASRSQRGERNPRRAHTRRDLWRGNASSEKAMNRTTGPRSKRKIFPSLYRLFKNGCLQTGSSVLGTSRVALTTNEFRDLMHDA